MVRTGQAQSPQLIEPPQPKQGLSWWWLAPCILAIAAFSVFWKPFWRLAGSALLENGAAPAATAAAPSQLGFSASHEGNDWRLVWSRDTIAKLNAVGAVLNIRDGGVDRLQFLSSQDLAAGAIFYVPRTNDLVFNLKVALASGPDIEEQIRVLGATPDQVPQLASRILQPRRIGEAGREETQAPESETRAAILRKFQLPAPSARPAPSSALDVPLPEVKLPAGAAPQIPQVALAAPPPSRPSVDAPKPVAPVASTQPSAEPPRQSPAVVTRVDPAPIRSVPASWPRNVARTLTTEVRILVRIDSRGRVVGATPVQRTVANFAFVDTALAAARSWTFSPALENGTPVNSETVLTFRFTP